MIPKMWLELLLNNIDKPLRVKKSHVYILKDWKRVKRKPEVITQMVCLALEWNIGEAKQES